MFTYTVRCGEYVLKVLKRAHARDASISLEDVRWIDRKPNIFEVSFPSPLNEKQKNILESEGMRFTFG